MGARKNDQGHILIHVQKELRGTFFALALAFRSRHESLGGIRQQASHGSLDIFFRATLLLSQR